MGERIALVTGGGRGIGREICLNLAGSGYTVAVTDVDGESAASVVSQIESLGGSAGAWVMDVADVGQVRRAILEIAERFGSVDTVVNNAGILHATAPESITEEEWDLIMAVNLKGAFFASQAALPYMKRNRWGRIIFISSLAGRMGGYANGLAYSASKAGMIGLSQGLARRVAQWNITVNAVAPGTTETDIIREFAQEKVTQLRAMIPLGRLGRPVDIANLVVFLASDAAEFITGTAIDVNGGMYMG